MILVRFIKPWSPYNPGEQAGFTDDQARRLVSLGVAQLAPPAAAVVSAPLQDKALHAPPLAKQRAKR